MGCGNNKIRTGNLIGGAQSRAGETAGCGHSFCIPPIDLASQLLARQRCSGNTPMTDKFSSSFCGFLSYLFIHFFVQPSASLRPTKADRKKERKPHGLRFFFFLIGWTCTMRLRPLQRFHCGECGSGGAAFDEAVWASARRVASFSWQR